MILKLMQSLLNRIQQMTSVIQNVTVFLQIQRRDSIHKKVIKGFSNLAVTSNHLPPFNKIYCLTTNPRTPKQRLHCLPKLFVISDVPQIQPTKIPLPLPLQQPVGIVLLLFICPVKIRRLVLHIFVFQGRPKHYSPPQSLSHIWFIICPQNPLFGRSVPIQNPQKHPLKLCII